jgi:hypothetical protein
MFELLLMAMQLMQARTVRKVRIGVGRTIIGSHPKRAAIAIIGGADCVVR